MTRKQKLQLEQSEKRQRINELLDKEDRSADETRGAGDAHRPYAGNRA